MKILLYISFILYSASFFTRYPWRDSNNRFISSDPASWLRYAALKVRKLVRPIFMHINKYALADDHKLVPLTMRRKE